MKSFLTTEPQVVPLQAVTPSKRVLFIVLTGLSVFLLLSLVVLCQAGTTRLHDEEAILAGQKVRAEMRFRSAEEAAATRPNDDEQFNRAMLDGEFAKAVVIADRRITERASAATYRDRGDAYFMLAQYEPSLRDYQEALKLSIKDPDELHFSITDFNSDYCRRADAYFKMGAYRDAIRDYRIAIATSTYPPSIWERYSPERQN